MKIKLIACILLATSAQANKFGSYSQREDLTSDPTFLDLAYTYLFPSFLKPKPMKKDDPDDLSPFVKNEFRLEFEDIVEDYGFKFKEFDVHTQDGYVLSLFRIRKRGLGREAPVVYL